MSVDGEIDYGLLTREQLDEALERIDRLRFPINYSRLVTERAKRSADAAVQAPATTRHRPVFTGRASEYFRIWIVNLALTIVTLGIYSAWAKVRKLRYFYGSTYLAGSTFGYHAAPLAILKGRLIAAALGAIYFGATQFSAVATVIVMAVLAVALPWLLVKSRAFAMRMTSWRGLRFAFREDYRGSYAVLLGWGAAAFLTLGLLIPVFLRERYRFIVTRTSYGGQVFDCEPSVGRFFKTAIVAAGLSLVVATALFALMGVAMGVFGPTGLSPAVAEMIGWGVALTVYLFVFALVGGYAQARNLNEVFNRTTIGPHRLVSALRARRLGFIYLTNILGIVLTLGLYTPWAQIRLVRYRLETIELEVSGSLDEFVAAAGSAAPAATGEEVSELFDVDFGL